MFYYPYGKCNFTLDQGVNHSQLHCLVCKWTLWLRVKLHYWIMCNNTHKKKAAGAGKATTLSFGVILLFY